MEPVALTTAGRVRGRERDGITSFRGIPYAAPPVGELRLRPPVAHPGWSGEREAFELGARAVQPTSMLAPPREAESEDCLVLNVWTPALDHGARPVMVWIHGGSFTTGSAGLTWYDGSRLAARGVVVVGVNYRLGPLGFLHLEAIGGPEWAGTANLGLADQAAALEWVRDNIAAFGGDPANVTIFGESAGAMSVSVHLARPDSRGLFRRAVAQSGSAAHVQSADQAAETAELVLERLGVASYELERLAEVPLEAFRDAVAIGEDRLRRVALPLPFQPTVDGSSLPVAPLDALAAGVARDVELITGTNADEMRLWWLMAQMAKPGDELTDERLLGRVERVVASEGAGVTPDQLLAAYRNDHPGATPSDVWLAIATDLTFRLPALRMLDAHRAGGGTNHLYLFTHPSTAFDGALGSAHSLEIPFVFDNLDRAGVDFMLGPIDDGRRRLAGAMADCWAGFASGRGVAVAGAGEWHPYEPSTRSTMVLDLVPGVVADPHAATREVWSGTA